MGRELTLTATDIDIPTIMAMHTPASTATDTAHPWFLVASTDADGATTLAATMAPTITTAAGVDTRTK